mmetsp:Transcript_20976/g.41122  ORF Transcript_20976/g.41122 Transcript_20976/m.41122 type:complete len:164 (-) Transcript_20976:983-1474(-)
MLGASRVSGMALMRTMALRQTSVLAPAPSMAARNLATAAAVAEEPSKRKRSRARKLPDAITITDAAVERIKALLARRPDAAGVRLGVKRRGCNGLSYTMDYADKFTFEDTVSKDGVTVGIDPKSLIYLVGSQMDYVEDELSAEFRFENPNSTGNCGCGESFSV